MGDAFKRFPDFLYKRSKVNAVIANAAQRVGGLGFRAKEKAHAVRAHHHRAMRFAEGLDRQGKERIVKAGPRLIAEQIKMFLCCA